MTSRRDAPVAFVRGSSDACISSRRTQAVRFLFSTLVGGALPPRRFLCKLNTGRVGGALNGHVMCQTFHFLIGLARRDRSAPISARRTRFRPRRESTLTLSAIIRDGYCFCRGVPMLIGSTGSTGSTVAFRQPGRVFSAQSEYKKMPSGPRRVWWPLRGLSSVVHTSFLYGPLPGYLPGTSHRQGSVLSGRVCRAGTRALASCTRTERLYISSRVPFGG